MFISKRNKRGLLALLIIAFLVAITPRLVSTLTSPDIQLTESDIKLLEDVRLDQEALALGNKEHYPSRKNKSYSRPPSKFDPNDYKLKDWERLGLSRKQALIVLKFTQYGIRSDEQLRRIFVIDNSLFELIKDSTYYRLDDAKVSSDHKDEKPEILKIDLNSATTDELIKLPGIGEYYANKIVQHRDRLGGYVSTKQLLDLWKFDEDKLAKIERNLGIEKKHRKLNINTAGIDELKAHPYISYKVANSIVKMRSQKGNYTSVDDVKMSKLIDNELYEQIHPYLKVK